MSEETNVVSLHGGSVPTEADARVVAALEAWLQMAKDGHLKAIQLVGVQHDGTLAERAYYGPGSGHQLLAAMTIAVYMTTKDLAGPQ